MHPQSTVCEITERKVIIHEMISYKKQMLMKKNKQKRLKSVAVRETNYIIRQRKSKKKWKNF